MAFEKGIVMERNYNACVCVYNACVRVDNASVCCENKGKCGLGETLFLLLLVHT